MCVNNNVCLDHEDGGELFKLFQDIRLSVILSMHYKIDMKTF